MLFCFVNFRFVFVSIPIYPWKNPSYITVWNKTQWYSYLFSLWLQLAIWKVFHGRWFLVITQSRTSRTIGRLPVRLEHHIFTIDTTYRRTAVVQIATRTVQAGVCRRTVILPVSDVLNVFESQTHYVIRIVTNDHWRCPPVSVARMFVTFTETTFPATVKIFRRPITNDVDTEFPVDW